MIKRILAIYLIFFSVFSCSNNTPNNHGEEPSYYYPVEVVKYYQSSGLNSTSLMYSIKGNQDKILGSPSGGSLSTPDNSSIVTLGEPGGYVIVEFDPPIENHSDNIGSYDFIVFGNAFWKPYSNLEYGVVEVLYENKWYVLIPEENRGKITKSESVYNKADFSVDQWVFGDEELVTVPCWSINSEVDLIGFADITPTLELGNHSWDYYTIPDTPGDFEIDPESGGGDAFKLEWAVDPGTFEPVVIDKVSQIKISTAKYYNADYSLKGDKRWMIPSTEVDAVVRVKKK